MSCYTCGHVTGNVDVCVTLGGDDVYVIVQGDPQVCALQTDTALVPVGLYQKVQHPHLVGFNENSNDEI